MKNFFANTEVAFQLKSDAELERAYFLFKMIAHEPLIRIGMAVTNFAIKVRIPVEGIIRSTVFDHFCGGINEADCMNTVDKMFKVGVSSVLDYSVEGKVDEAQFDDVVERTLKLLDSVYQKQAIPFAVFKPTGIGRLDLYAKVNNGEELSKAEQEEWSRIYQRYDIICKKAYELNVGLLIDAEESWIQNAVDDLVEEMMEKYNTKRAIVFNTLQMYRWDRMEYLKKIHTKAQEKGFYIGMKLVRGAYMEKENERAKEKGYKSPICVSKEATDENFNEAVRFMIHHIDTMEIFLGSHNEESTLLALSLMEERSIQKDDNRIWFGQLYGMSDHISFNLSKCNYNVAKYLPFGPVSDVMPYLIRRAEENTSVANQTSRELTLLKTERDRRKI